MSSEPEKADIEKSPRLAAEEVRAFLTAHPDFLSENPALLAQLTPPAYRRGSNVLDMQRFMIERLQGEVTRLDHFRDELIAASRSNMASQSQIHAAVLALLKARSFEQLIHVATGEFTSLLDVDAVALCVEANGSTSPEVGVQGVRILKQGTVDRLMGEGREILLRDKVAGERAVFRSHAKSIRSDALVRLHINAGAPTGLLALGAEDETKFHPGQGTELLAFLGKSLEHCIRAWLNLPR